MRNIAETTIQDYCFRSIEEAGAKQVLSSIYMRKL
jgi:hypothetical protein